MAPSRRLAVPISWPPSPLLATGPARVNRRKAGMPSLRPAPGD